VLTLNLGPLAVSGAHVALAAAMIVAAAAGRLAGRSAGTGIGHVLVDMLLAGLIVGRIVFVVVWFDLYRGAPWSILDVRDGGFTPWAAWSAAFLTAVWRARRMPALRAPLAVGLAVGGIAWVVMNGAVRLLERPALPDLTLVTLAGDPVVLSQVAAGKPMVVNLWATWCPPCRREMPVLAAAQRREKGIHVVFVNQGEDAVTVHRYLAATEPDLEHVLLDRAAALGRAVGSSALPTTLFYDARGRLVATHLGELSAASLASKLQPLVPSGASSSTGSAPRSP
jgi:thiol-disulfide isomerase/thioredoxin